MSVIDLGQIKTEIKSLLDTANTTTAAPLDLSSGMTDRVREVGTINITRIPFQPSFYPAVTIYYDNKIPEEATIARDQLQARRKAKLQIQIAGIVFLSTVTDDLTDDADNEIEKLMENIEQVLRQDSTLGGTVLWTGTDKTEFHNVNISEDSMMRVGIMDFFATVFY